MRRTVSLALLGYDLGVDVVSEVEKPSPTWVFYLHGGGMLYGTRDDLPARHADALVHAGATLWCPDYPLAPETPLPTTSRVIDALWDYFCAEAQAAGASKLVAFGRSAGAYLVFALAKRLHARGLREPDGVASFYGYSDLNDPELSGPSKYYLSFPLVGERVARALVREKPPVSESISARFALYVHARQTGTWQKLLGLDREAASELSLSDNDIAVLPPLFLAASTGDKDVPYSCTKHLQLTAQSAQLYTAYYLEHDFDRDERRSEGGEAYRRMTAWMDSL